MSAGARTAGATGAVPCTARGRLVIQMRTPRQRQLLLAVTTLVTVASTVVVAAANGLTGPSLPERWVATWGTATSAAFGAAPTLPSAGGFDNQTVRELVHTTVGGTRARVRLTNRY